MINSTIKYSFFPKYNYGGKWSEHGSVWTKGYAFLPTGKLLQNEKLASYINTIFASKNYLDLIKKLNGRFVATGIFQTIPFILTDRIRSFPLFYHYDMERVKISDAPFSLSVPPQIINETAYQQFLASGFTWEDKTLLKKINQCEPSHLIFFHKERIEKIKYFSYSTNSIKKISERKALDELSNILEHIMERTLRIIGDKPVAVPLTGGFDSRFLITWLAKKNLKNLTTFTCGTPESPEFENAQKVASKLNISWQPIIHNNKTIKKIFTEDFPLNEYVDFSSGASSMSYFQDVSPIYNRQFAKDTIIVGGHFGGFIGGCRLFPFQNLMNKSLSIQYATKRFFPYFEKSQKQKKMLKQVIIKKYNQQKGDLPYSIIEEIDFKERQSKFIANSTRTYDFFAGSTILPFCDNEIVDFFRTLPFKLKLNKKLYHLTLKNNFFKPAGLNFEKELQPTYTDIYRQLIKYSLPKFIAEIYTRRKNVPDYLNYKTISKLISKDNFSIKKNFFHPNQLIIHWYLQYLEQKLHR
jgi:asparagine synthase (glutamine-hydrolysing)